MAPSRTTKTSNAAHAGRSCFSRNEIYGRKILHAPCQYYAIYARLQTRHA